MQIQPISNRTSNTAFGAKINLVGGTFISENAKKLLPKNSFRRLEEKAKNIGTLDFGIRMILSLLVICF